MLHNRLSDWNAVSLIVKSERDSGDDILARYELCWWANFKPSTDVDAISQAPVDIIQCWNKQRKNLPAPIPLPPLGLVQLRALADEDLDRAWDIGCDGMKSLDMEIADNEKFIADVTVMLVRSQAMLEDFRIAGEKALEREEARKED